MSAEHMAENDVNGDVLSSGKHQRIRFQGSDVCDTCVNVLGLNIRWDQAPCQYDQAEKGPRCLVVTDGHGTECGHPAEGSVYDESDQCEVPAYAGHIVGTARGRVADYRPTPPAEIGDDR